MYKIYILLCFDNSFYTGYTKNLKQKLLNHNNGNVKATKGKRPLKLVYYEKYTIKEEAIKREKQIKGGQR